MRGALVLLTAILAACSPEGRVSDTGFIGKWQRQIGNSESTFALWQEGDGYGFCWTQPPSELGREVLCVATGHSEERVRGQKVYEYRFEVRPEQGSDHLLVSVQGTPINPLSTPIQWVDRLVLQPGGLELWVYQIELNGQPRPNPSEPYKFTKVSDDPQ